MKNKKRTSLLMLTTLILLSLFSIGQNLPRRVYLGIRMENLTDGAKSIMGLENKKGILITEILPRSTAEKAGFKKGDVLCAINDKTFNSTQEVLTALAGQLSGTSFTYEIIRNKKTLKGKSVFQSFPEEKYNDIDVVYTESKSEIGLQRIIITKPESESDKKFPVIVYIGGIGCYSLDAPMDTSRSEIQLLNYLTRSGFMCARLEKPGMGDNAKHCKSCQEVSFMEETTGYVNAINTIKQRADVDSNAVFVIGHSMGGVFAPLIAKKTNLKGIISYGTIGSGFIEYLAKTRRTIAEAYSMSPVETDDLVKDFCECSGYYFVEKMTTAEAAAKKEICREYLSIFDLRARKYNDELYSFNIPELWSTFTNNALFIWGESDYISSREDHLILNNTVNYYHKGNSEFITIKNADHAMNLSSSFRDAQKSPGPYNREVSVAVLKWLTKIS